MSSNKDIKRIKVQQIIQYLDNLSRLHGEMELGNPTLAQGLRELSRILQPNANLYIHDLAQNLSRKRISESEIIQNSTRNPTRNPTQVSKRIKIELPADLNSISCEDIMKILMDERYLKGQIIEVGCIRFGIPRSRLKSLTKRQIIDIILSILDNKNALEIISQEARKRGEQRSL